MNNEAVRGWVYLLSFLAVAVALVISVVQKNWAQSAVFLAILFPTGLATANTDRSPQG